MSHVLHDSMPSHDQLLAMLEVMVVKDILIGEGEQAGSGIDKIHQGWQSHHWRFPSIREQVQPDRVRVILPMVSLIPEDSLRRLRKLFGAKFNRLTSPEVQAL